MADCDIPDYLPASFKGVPFEVESTTDDVGRRGAEYEYPLAEMGAYKDLGRKLRRYKVSGYLIGGDHLVRTAAVSLAAESPEPGLLIHPGRGPVLCACVSLSISIDYKTEARRTKLDWDFVEANPSLGLYILGIALSFVMGAASAAVSQSYQRASWTPGPRSQAAATRLSTSLAKRVEPASDEASRDASAMLQRGLYSATSYRRFADAADPIDNGTATVRRIHSDAMVRLKAFNADAIAEGEREPQIESLVVTSRLATVRDFALASTQTTYATVADALTDLDFVMGVYDEEEVVATRRCDDPLVQAIHLARAAAATSILSNNIRLPGVATFDAHGVWPSLVTAHKIYGDATRHVDLENYNAQDSPFWINSHPVGPAA